MIKENKIAVLVKDFLVELNRNNFITKSPTRSYGGRTLHTVEVKVENELLLNGDYDVAITVENMLCKYQLRTSDFPSIKELEEVAKKD